jgi:hypothetical protein
MIKRCFSVIQHGKNQNLQGKFGSLAKKTKRSKLSHII